LSRNDYIYVLHCNTNGWETAARPFSDKESALTAFAAEVQESLQFASYGVRSSSHTLKCFANAAGQPGHLLEGFLVTTVDWVGFEPSRKSVETIRVKRRQE